MDPSTCEALERARAGDNDALGKLLLRHVPRLLLLIEHDTRHPGLDADRKQDILSEVLCQAIESLERFEYRGDGSFYAWIARITRNRLIDAGRRSGRGIRAREKLTAFQTSCFSLADKAAGIITRLERSDRTRRFFEALDSLPGEQRSLLSLVHLEGLTVMEAGKRLGLPKSTAHDRLLRAAERFKEAWQRRAR